jgi:hypothetical protein
MPRPALSLLAGAWCAVALAACDDPFAITANFSNLSDTLSVYALTGTPAAYPSGLATTNMQVVRVDGGFAFDIAFDLDASGKVKLLPARLVGGAYVLTKTVGIQKAKDPFDGITKAPTGGYNFDSITVVAPGEAVMIQVNDPVRCQFQFSPLLYSKLVVDSVQASTKQVYFHMLADPNCGFRGLSTGTPKD